MTDVKLLDKLNLIITSSISRGYKILNYLDKELYPSLGVDTSKYNNYISILPYKGRPEVSDEDLDLILSYIEDKYKKCYTKYKNTEIWISSELLLMFQIDAFGGGITFEGSVHDPDRECFTIILSDDMLKMPNNVFEMVLFHELGHVNTEKLNLYNYDISNVYGSDYRLVEFLADSWAANMMGYDNYIKGLKDYKKYNRGISNLDAIEKLIDCKNQLESSGMSTERRAYFDRNTKKILMLK